MMAISTEIKKGAVSPPLTEAEATIIIDELWTISDNFDVENDTHKYIAILKLLSKITRKIPS